jgi:hypothetical protein
MKESDMDFPIARAFFTEKNWFPRQSRPLRPEPSLRAEPLDDELRQTLAGWQATAAYWQGRCARAEAEAEVLQRRLDQRRVMSAVPFHGIRELEPVST